MSFRLSFAPWPSAEEPAFEYAEVPWDSRTFGFPVYEVRVPGTGERESLGEALRAWTTKCLPPGKTFAFTKIDATDLVTSRAFAQAGFYVAEASLDIAVSLAKMTPIPAPKRPFATLRAATEADIPAVVEIAKEAFTHDRFHLDPGFPREAADTRYAGWVEGGFRSGDPLYVFESTGAKPTVAGFYLLKRVDETSVNLSLAAVGRVFRQSGLGGLMYQDVLVECQRLGFRRAETTISASNTDVANVFARLGFGILRTRFCLHRFGG